MRTYWLPILMAWSLLTPATHAWSDDAISKEYQIKAAFLFNFVRFSEWPSSSFSGDDAPIRIGILGNDPFGSALDGAVRDETVHNRKVVIIRSRQINDLDGCQLIFIARSEQSHGTDILSALSRRPILTVSDCDQFAEHGGVIGLNLAGNKVRFDINLACAQQQRVKLSAQLLHLGHIVDTASNEGGK